MSNEIQVYSDEYNKTLLIYLNIKLMYTGSYIRSTHQLRELIDNIKKSIENPQVVIHLYRQS